MIHAHKKTVTKEQLGLESPTKKTHLELFERLAAAPDNTKPMEKGLLLLCTPRCGSTLFAEVLNNTGRLGLCDEWFNYEYFGAYIDVLGKDFVLQEYISFVAQKTLRETGVFCLKWHIGQLVSMNEKFSLGLESMEFDHIVYLYRRDKIAQAVSLAKAIKTGVFRSYELNDEPEPEITNADICDALTTITRFDEWTRKYMWEYVDVEYAYEDFWMPSECNISPVFNGVLEKLDKPPVNTLTAGRLRRQANDKSLELMSRFQTYVGFTNETDH